MKSSKSFPFQLSWCTNSVPLRRAAHLGAAFVVLVSMLACGGASRPAESNPGTGGSGSPSSSKPSIVAYVYVGATAQSAAHQISGLSVTSDGVAQFLPGSPYAGPSLSPVVSSGFLFATDNARIQTYTRSSDGSLRIGPSISGTAHNDTPNDSAVGVLTLDRSGQSLYAGEINFEGADNNAYAEFSVGQNGVLSFLANSLINVNAGGPLRFTQNDEFAYTNGCFFATWDLSGYQRLADGTLQTIVTNGNPPPSGDADLCPDFLAVSAQNVLAVAFHSIGPVSNTQLATYVINTDGTLTLNAHSVVSTPFTGVTALAFDPTGAFLAVAGTGGVQMYQLGTSGMLTVRGSPALNVQADDVEWDKVNHVYAISGTNLWVLNFSNGSLKAATGSPYSVPVHGSLAVLPAS